jgi:hypothetical protein
VGSSDPKKKAILKSPQSRAWTSFIEAATATGRFLASGIVFKGQELQEQWFLDEFKEIGDWYVITSDNGWTNNHIGLSWLTDVYDPQKKPQDASDARLIIMDGHGSHVTDGWMSFCFLNNIYCCYFPAYCSHGMQPLDNGPFNSLKAAYRKGLKTLSSLNDSRPVDKINFIMAYSKARTQGLTEQNIKSAFRTTGNWPISRRKALSHLEIQQIQEPTTPDRKPAPEIGYDSEVTPKTSRNIRNMGRNKSPTTRRRYGVIAKGFAQLEFQLSTKDAKLRP